MTDRTQKISSFFSNLSYSFRFAERIWHERVAGALQLKQPKTLDFRYLFSLRLSDLENPFPRIHMNPHSLLPESNL
ncbi:MAG: hypothetical protein AB1690_00765 [Candidatus Zixiibacteriota bacterium]